MARTRSSPMLASSEAIAPKRRATPAAAPASAPATILLDSYRAFIFPNRIREQRRRLGLQKLMALSELLPEIPYIRLSKIERGEVVARAGELERIARVLGIAPLDLLSDVTQPTFDIAAWAQPFVDGRPAPEAEERFAVMLAAALRVRRNADAGLTITALERDYGLPAVILSRLENAYKTLDRWNQGTIASVCRLFGVADEAALRTVVADRYRAGALDGYVGRIADPAARAARTRDLIAALRAALQPQAKRRTTRTPTGPSSSPPIPATTTPPTTPPRAASAHVPEAPRMLPVVGSPLPGGLVAATLTEAVIAAPQHAGPRAFGLRVCRATLGAGLPAGAIVVVDPDRTPTAGGLAAIRSAEGYRLVSVTFDRMGATKGYSVMPDLEIDLDALDPADLAAVIAAVFP